MKYKLREMLQQAGPLPSTDLGTPFGLRSPISSDPWVETLKYALRNTGCSSNDPIPPKVER